jgi:hypothetical protein
VTPVNDPPVARPDKASTPLNTPITLHVTSNDSDPEGDSLTVTVGTQPLHGTVTCGGSTGSCTYTPAAGFTGTDSYTYTVRDGHGGTATATVTITVPNGAPTANPDTIAVLSGTPAVIPVLGNDTDPNGDPLTVISHTNPSHGTVTCTPAGAATVCTYTATPGYTGPDTFTYTVSDGHGNTSTTTVSTTVTNPSDSGNGGGGNGIGGGSGGGGTGSGGGGTGGSGGGGKGGGLPFTGADTQSQSGWALGMLGFGLVLLLAGRKRRTIA